ATTNALVNDLSSPTAILSYRSSSAPHPAAITFMTPPPNSGSTFEPVGSPLEAWITDGSDGAIQASSIALKFDNSPITVTPTKTGAVTKLVYMPTLSNPLPAGSHTVSLAFTDASGNAQTNSVTFNVAGYTVIPPSLALPANVVDKTKTGFNIWTYQAIPHGPGDANTGAGNFQNSVYVWEMEMHGYMGWPNAAD